MSTSKLGLVNGWATGQTISANNMNDLHETLDNQLGNLSALLNPDGVISGWTLTATDDLTVAAGEGWVNGAHCKTTIDQAITGITANTTNYIYAQFKAAASGRVSESFALGTVDFVANTTGVAPEGAILIATGVVNAGATEFSSVDNSPTDRKDMLGIVGLGTGADNTVAGVLDAKYQVIADTGEANAEITIAHGLSRTPIGYLLIMSDKACILYNGSTAWDATNIYLKCSVATCAVTILIF